MGSGGGGLSFYALHLLGNSFSFLSQGFIDQFCCLWNTGDLSLDASSGSGIGHCDS